MSEPLTSQRASEMLKEQLKCWPLAAKNYADLAQAKIREFDMGGFLFRVQFNPSRMVSTGAKLDKASLEKRPCFLCPANLPAEQLRLPFGKHYQLLCNPFPIFPEHFTIPSLGHEPQLIRPRFRDLLRLAQALDQYTVFYNGPKCGASAPDHTHFQAGTRFRMPYDEELSSKLIPANLLTQQKGCSLYLLHDYLRNGLIIVTADEAEAEEMFFRIYDSLPIQSGETEPMMNIFANYVEGRWVVTIIPRRLHRPWQYSAEGKDKFLSSPGAADLGGLLITPREEDFLKVSPELIRDIFRQVCFTDEELSPIARHFANS